jgi:glutathione S-transferase
LKIPYKFTAVDLGNKSEEFQQAYAKALNRDKNNDGKVPIIFNKNRYLTESLIVVRYLHNEFKNENNCDPNAIFPMHDAFLLAAVEGIADYFMSNCYSFYYKLLMSKTENYESAIAPFLPIWKELNERLSVINDGTAGEANGYYYLNGNLVSLFEVVAWPIFVRLAILKNFQPKFEFESFVGVESAYPRIGKWYAQVSKSQWAKNTAPQTQLLVE